MKNNIKTFGKKKLGEILLEEGMINELQLAIALGDQKQWGGKLGSTIVRKGFIREADMAYILSKQLGVEWVSLKDLEVPDDAQCLVSGKVAQKYNVMPVKLCGTELTVAVSDPTDLKLVDTVKFVSGKRVKAVIAMESDIVLCIARHYDGAFIDRNSYEDVVVSKKAMQRPAGFEPTQHAAGTSRGSDVTNKKTLDSLIKLLIKKKIINKDELLDLMRNLE